MATELTIFHCQRETSRIVSEKEPHELSFAEIEMLGVACSKCGKTVADTGEIFSVKMHAFW